MLINMLKAVDNMLSPPYDKVDNLITRVECARVILGEVIASIETHPKQELHEDLSAPIIVPITAVIDKRTPKEKLESAQTVEVPEGGFMVTVDENKKLKHIKGLPLDALLELDGKQLKHKEAIGMTFKQARIL